jgi:hypothetical protein
MFNSVQDEYNCKNLNTSAKIKIDYIKNMCAYEIEKSILDILCKHQKALDDLNTTEKYCNGTMAVCTSCGQKYCTDRFEKCPNC